MCAGKKKKKLLRGLRFLTLPHDPHGRTFDLLAYGREQRCGRGRRRRESAPRAARSSKSFFSGANSELAMAEEVYIEAGDWEVGFRVAAR
jgi:hypothetical protein